MRSFCASVVFPKRLNFVFIINILTLLLLCLVVFKRTSIPNDTMNTMSEDVTMFDDILHFEGFDNENASLTRPRIVPNVVHLLFMNKTALRFHEMICLLSIYMNHRPDRIIIHCENCSFTGYYWDKALAYENMSKVVRLHRIPVYRTIYNQQIQWLEHMSDIWRMIILRQYGGIYLDNDVYVISSLDEFRQFEMTVGREQGHIMGNQVILAHRNARLLTAILDSFRTNYKSDVWFWNGGQWPGQILKEHPYMAHMVQERFGVTVGTELLYNMTWPGWRGYYAFHTLVNHRYYLDKKGYAIYKEFDETNIWKVNHTFAEMARDILLKLKKQTKD